jgi:hypothetical protein
MNGQELKTIRGAVYNLIPESNVTLHYQNGSNVERNIESYAKNFY